MIATKGVEHSSAGSSYPLQKPRSEHPTHSLHAEPSNPARQMQTAAAPLGWGTQSYPCPEHAEGHGEKSTLDGPEPDRHAPHECQHLLAHVGDNEGVSQPHVRTQNPTIK